MQLGFVSAILPEQTFDRTFQIASEIGYDCVEVCCWPAGKAERRYAGVSHIDVAHMTEHVVSEIRKTIDATGVLISALGYYPNPLSPVSGEAEAAVAHLHVVIEVRTDWVWPMSTRSSAATGRCRSMTTGRDF